MRTWPARVSAIALGSKPGESDEHPVIFPHTWACIQSGILKANRLYYLSFIYNNRTYDDKENAAKGQYLIPTNNVGYVRYRSNTSFDYSLN
jgi:hypothetical protein